jgi:intracellular septation protein
MMESNIQLPDAVWLRLNTSWVVFFMAMGFANLYVVYNFDTDTWVNFKLFGLLGLTFAFVILQAIYLARHIKTEEGPPTPDT